jgi:predicted DNA-binding transcriptional regulator AlpA
VFPIKEISMPSVIDKPEKAIFLSQSAVLADAIPDFTGSPSTLMRWVKNSQFPAPLKIGGRYFWEAASIAEWKAARIREARTQSTVQSKE